MVARLSTWIIEATVCRNPGKEKVQVATGRWYLACARVGRVKKLKAYGKAAVLAGLAFLDPLLSCETRPPALAMVRVKLLAENLAGRFGVKIQVPVKILSLRKHGLTLEIPESSEWTIPPATGEGNFDVKQVMLRIIPRRQIKVHSWKSDARIYVDKSRDKAVAVAKPKALAMALLPGLSEMEGIEQAAPPRKPRKAKLHRGFTDVWLICVEGFTGENRWMRVSSYYFRSKKTNRTYNLRVVDAQNETMLDPEFDLFLKRLRLRK